MKLRNWIALVLSLWLLPIFGASAQDDFKRTEDVVYGRKYGMALTLDVFQPPKPNGVGIIFIISGGWISAHEAINPLVLEPFLHRGYTVFAVCHGCQPKFTVSEIIPDMHRAVRFIRHNAGKYDIDPQRLGVIGASAGGHLSLVLATQLGADALAKSKDSIDHESSAVQCVACFFPPTDFLNYGTNGVIAFNVPLLQPFKVAFGPRADTNPNELGHEISPIYYLTTNLPPVLIFHGDADTLVPIQQSQSFAKKAAELGDTVKIIVREKQWHGWPTWATTDMGISADWFDEHLRGLAK